MMMTVIIRANVAMVPAFTQGMLQYIKCCTAARNNDRDEPMFCCQQCTAYCHGKRSHVRPTMLVHPPCLPFTLYTPPNPTVLLCLAKMSVLGVYFDARWACWTALAATGSSTPPCVNRALQGLAWALQPWGALPLRKSNLQTTRSPHLTKL